MKPKSKLILKEIYDKMDSYEISIKETREKYVDKFKEKFDAEMQKNSVLVGSSLLSSGSSADGTAISKNADFDIEIVFPLDTKKYKIHKTCTPGSYKLFEKGQDEYVDVATYAKHIFKQIHQIMTLIEERATDCTYEFEGPDYHRFAAFELKMIIKGTNQEIEMDLVPQLAVSDYKDVPEVNREALSIAKKVDQQPVYLSLCAPPTYKDADKNYIVQVAFGVVEKLHLQPHHNVQIAIKLCKIVCKMDDLPIRSFYIKRVAIQNLTSLSRKSIPWKIHQNLLKFISLAISSSRGLESYFVEDHILVPGLNAKLSQSVKHCKCYGPQNIPME